MDISNLDNKSNNEEQAQEKELQEFETVKKTIVEGAQELFWMYGLRSVTMDDIASKLAMSKKTLYQYIQDKAELVYLCAEHQLENEHCNMEEASEKAEHAIDEVLKIMEYNRQFFLNFHPSLLLDLQRSYPKAWKMFLRHKEEKIIKGIQENMQRGVAEGLYRADIDPEVIARMRMAQVESIFNPQIFSPKTYIISELKFQIFKHFLYGLVTIKGHKTLTEALQNSELSN
ncbi:transcriptional regulator [Bernardetia litoralis DSM 6794]|uniref:Transcriptional regulator n=1 Tax=Bernardetia litoralis (strain ATCC 23117 / DSM 6794 / NBRC 15988 / NCIMB 1366 / Fx l1 / Sio-4) TaxID=880071 RepID=I4AN21_BERLS|nr:TetR/AcrR family transcriptional regulator [Bernardetia litoralis]AFM05356.1 transcriptional regulator [Bernardetia litoralis DSM 6794]